MAEVRVWSLFEGEYWVAAETKAQALSTLQAQANEEGWSHEWEEAAQEPGGVSCVPLSPQAMETHDYYEEGEEPITFAQRLEEMKADPHTSFPCMFAWRNW